MKKPLSMTVQEYVSRVGELNQYLTEFPPSAVALTITKLPEDELMDILEFSVPQSWKRQMLLMDFNPIDSTPAQFVNFCQRLELTENKVEKKSKEKT